MKPFPLRINPRAFSAFSRQFWPGVVSAIVAFPLSIGLAIIAGVPPEAMIAASVYAYVISALLSASRYGVGGPNTAVAIITGAAVAPFATNETDLYFGYVLTLCLMAGLLQFLAALVLRRVDIMDYIPATVIDGLTLGIGAVFILSSLHLTLGLAPDFGNQWIIFNAYVSLVNAWAGDGNHFAMVVAACALTVGIVCWRWRRINKFAIVAAVIAGTLISLVLSSQFETRIENVGFIQLNLLSTSLPDLREVSWTTIAQLSSSAIAIAVIGILQTLSIAKGLRHPGEPYNAAQEVACQGTQNVFMAFFAGAPVSNSFNKSAIMYQLHGGRLSSIIAAFVTAGVVTFLPGFVGILPMSALGAALILVGMSMMHPKRYLTHFRHGHWRATLLLATAASVVILSVQEAIIVGALGAAVYHFTRLVQPAWKIERSGPNLDITLQGPLFYASAAKLNRKIEPHLESAIAQRLRVRIHVVNARLLTSDTIEADWLHRLVKAGCAVHFVCLPHQVEGIKRWMRMNVLPKSIQIAIEGGSPTTRTRRPKGDKPRIAA